MRKLAAALALYAALGHAQAGAPMDAETERRAAALAQQLRCVVCQNQSIADSQAELAIDLRREVRAQLALGKTDAEVLAFVADRYGDFVLYRPPFRAATVLLWCAPLLLLAAGMWLLLRIVRRQHGPDGEDAP